MTRKIFRSILITVIAVLVLSFSIITAVLYNHFNDVGKTQLNEQLNLVIQGVEASGEQYLSMLNSKNNRITWVASDGTVLFDTEVEVQNLDNHIDREEIKEALENGFGESSRYSDTLTKKMIYSAKCLSDGTVLRISTSVDSVFVLLLDVIVPMIFIILFALVISVLIARRMAKGIVEPLDELDLENPAENEVYKELSPILGKINKQRRQIVRQIELLKQRTDEFEQVTASMSEGLVLLDTTGIVLSMNLAARKLFQIETEPVGCDFLTVDRSIEMSQAVYAAFDGKHTEFRKRINGSEYQFGISSIESEGKNIGAVILCFDVSEVAFAERNRQEFTANVSHELKTPLQSIIGSAELLESGLVKEEDTKRFVGHIKNEASRLVSLINDIIRLSQLDENSELLTESVDLYNIANEVIEVLTVSATKRNVTLHLNGESAVINGINRYLYEIIYNLCDNAIRYNVDGGKVTISLQKENSSVILTVSDTGIGIPLEHQARIFERFYRVDKSHSKETGGTGLGLSIVKHAVVYHGGTIKVDSILGKGTTFTAIF